MEQDPRCGSASNPGQPARGAQPAISSIARPPWHSCSSSWSPRRGLWQFWTSIHKDAQTRSATLAYLLAEQTTRTFQAVDLTLAGLDPVYQAATLPDHAATFEKLLAQRVTELDFIHALYVVDAAGRVTQTSGAIEDVVSDLSAQPYFAAFARDPKLKLLIGQPLFGRPGTLSAIPVMRRITTADGRFGGMMVASVEPSYFSDFYRNVDLGRRGSIDLYQDNGSILLASTSETPAAEAMPNVAWAPTFDLASTLGSFRSPASESNRRFVAFHRAVGYPLVVAVGIDLVDLKLRWWRVAGPTLAALGAIVLLGIAVAVMVARRLDERRQARRRALTAQKLEALGQMTASVSHDFRNLLAVMTSTLRLVRKRGPEEHILKAAEEAVERGSSLITQLLAFSKRNDLQVRSADIDALLTGLEPVLRYAAGPGVTLRIERAEGLPRMQDRPDAVRCRADEPRGQRSSSHAEGRHDRRRDAGLGHRPFRLRRTQRVGHRAPGSPRVISKGSSSPFSRRKPTSAPASGSPRSMASCAISAAT